MGPTQALRKLTHRPEPQTFENEKIMVRSKGKYIYTATFILESVEEGTKVTSVLDYEIGEIFGKFLEKLFVRRMEEKYIQRSLEKLKSILEK